MTMDDVAALLIQLEPTDTDTLRRIAQALRIHAAAAAPGPKLMLEAAADRVDATLAGSGADDLAAASKLVHAAVQPSLAGPKTEAAKPAAPPAAAPPAAAAPPTPATATPATGTKPPSKNHAVLHAPDYEAARRPVVIPAETERDMVEAFVAEAKDLLQGAEASMLALEDDPSDQKSIDTVFRAFHTVKGVTAMLGFSLIADFAHRAENLLSRVRDKEIRFEGGYANLSLRSLDAVAALVEAVNRTLQGETAQPPDDLPELLRALTDPEAAGYGPASDPGRPAAAAPAVAPANPADDATEVPLSGGTPRQAAAVPTAPVAVAAREPSAPPTAEAGRAKPEAAHHGEGHGDKGGGADNSVRVRTDRLDRLIDMVGELVIAQSMVAQDEAMRAGGRHELIKKISHAGKIVRELQDLSMSLRMVPLKAAFQKAARVVRDTARKIGKQVVFDTDGEDVELDRNMVDLIADPLVHMVRNSVDHGIEYPEARRAEGKPEAGTIRLAAFHSGGNVVVRLADDGHGLDRAKIVKKALERGLVRTDAGMSDSEVYNLIFEAGFSTSEKITDVSGRGVGMDVVRRAVESLKGRIEIESTLGKGSSFSLHLPLTLAITDGMLVRVGDQRYLIPTVNMQQSFRPEEKQLATIGGGKGELVILRGAPVPLFRLHRLFGVRGAREKPTEALVVVVGDANGQAAILVDELLEQRQVVAKSLGEGMPKIRGVSGGAVLGDGTVGLILDPAGIVDLANTEELAVVG